MRLAWAWVALIGVVSGAVNANEPFSTEKGFPCGGANIEFSFEKRSLHHNEDHVEAILTVSGHGRTTVLRYGADLGELDFIGGLCAKGARGKPIVLFQAYCGGSGCHDLDNWGIINPSDLRVLLVPNDWNRHDAEKILGHPLPTTEGKFAGRQFPMIDSHHMISLHDERQNLGLKW